jgi:hypothetical protein
MKSHRMIIAVVVVLASTVLFYGCTGTRMLVTPDPNTLQVSVQKKCGSAIIKETYPERIYPPAGSLVPGFARELEKSGLFEPVYYPSRADDKSDTILDSRFDVQFRPTIVGNMAKSIAIGLTLFVLEPVFWYDFDYDLKAEIAIYKGKSLVKTINVQTKAEFDLKWLSLGRGWVLEAEILKKAKVSLYKQLLIKLNDYCGSNAAATANPASSVDECVEACKKYTNRTPEQCFDECKQ